MKRILIRLLVLWICCGTVYSCKKTDKPITDPCFLKNQMGEPCDPEPFLPVELPHASPESQGVRSEDIISFMDNLEQQNMNMHSFMLLRNGKVLAECYWPFFSANKKQRLYSAGKSFTSLAIGMMVDEGRIFLNDKVVDYFPEYMPITNNNILNATIRDLLMMAALNASVTYSTSANANWVTTTFSASQNNLGTYNYGTPPNHVLTAIVEKLSGKPMLEYMRPLFDQMGISMDIWCVKAPEGYSWTGSGILCTAQDLAKFGLLALNRGEWFGKQLISREYMEAATTRQISDNGQFYGYGYGYQFICGQSSSFLCEGLRGQFVIGIPSKNLLLVATADDRSWPIYSSFFTLANKIVSTTLSENLVAKKQLEDKIANVFTPLPTGSKTTAKAADYSGVTYTFSGRGGFNWMKVDISPDECIINYQSTYGTRKFILGMDKYILQELLPEKYFGSQVGVYDTQYNTIGGGAWENDNKLAGMIYAIDDYLGYIKITLSFESGKLRVTMENDAVWFFDNYLGTALSD